MIEPKQMLAAVPILAAMLTTPTSAQTARELTVGAFGAFTTSSKLFLHPEADNEILRSEFSPVNSVLSAGVEVRGNPGIAGLYLGLGAEYIRKTTSETVPNTPEQIPIEDGYMAVPVELTGYFFIPVGGQSFRLYMGGGGGVYFGQRIYRYAGVTAGTVEKDLNFGIHVLTGFQFGLSENLALRTELKFRNITLESVQQFSQPSAIWEGQSVPLPAGPLPSRIQIDGMQVLVGVAYSLF